MASVVGVVLAFGTLGTALWARFTAKSAEQVAQETRRAVTRTLGLVDVQRAISESRRLAELVRDERFEVAVEVVPRVLMVLNDLESRIPGLQPRYRDLVEELGDRVQGVQAHLERHVAGQGARPREDLVSDVNDIVRELMRVSNAFPA